jgi:hypothetical protein
MPIAASLNPPPNKVNGPNEPWHPSRVWGS